MYKRGVATPEAPRFWAKVNKTDTCWLWTGDLHKDGYGNFWPDNRRDVRRRSVRAHRWAYEHLVGAIPDGLQIDHLCRVRNCVNPDHLEAVTFAENVARGARASQTHCKNGHPFDAANTYWRKGGGRGCRTCNSENVRRYKQRQLAAA